MQSPLRYFFLILILEFVAIYNLQGLHYNPTLPEITQDCPPTDQITIDDYHFPSGLLPFEILESDIEEESDEESHYHAIVHFGNFFGSLVSIRSESYIGISGLTCFRFNVPLFIVFHTWKFHL